jgi:2-hydroxy-3-keto-5-methylthiopentenyl-1-phosphate phosphatase
MKVISIKNINNVDIDPPQARECQVWIDFDGTITQKDTLDELINKYSVDNSWELIERQWQAGLLGSRECLEKEFSLLKIPSAELERVIQDFRVDSGIHNLLQLLRDFNVPITILSDGIDIFIEQILYNNGISDILIRSNTMLYKEPRLELKCPHNDPGCDVNAAHCKCSSISKLGDPHKRSIYIGDGHSDLCPARKADFIFAKNALAQCLNKEKRPFVGFSDLLDVTSFLSAKWNHDQLSAETGYAALSVM